MLFLWSIDPLFLFYEVFKPRGTDRNAGMRGSSLRKARPSGLGMSSLLSLLALEVLLCVLRKFPYQMDAATLVSPHCKVGTKAVWLLYLGAK